MQMVEIGASGLKIAPLILGGNVFGWTADEAQSFKILDAFVDRGFNCIDTSDFYNGGQSEIIIGKWLAQGGGRREHVILCTKVGLELGPGEKGLSAAYLARAAEKSLRQMQTDRIDLYYSHIDDPSVPLEETLGGYDALIKAGKVRAIAASNYSGERLAEALDVSAREGLPRYEGLQTCYNLYDRGGYEGALEKLCVDQNLAVLPYFALASGFLTGKYRTAADYEGKAREPLARRYLDDRGLRILAVLDEVAGARNLPLGQVALAWLSSRPSVAAPLASATNLAQLDDLFAAMELRLSTDELAKLDRASDPHQEPLGASS